MNPKVSLKAASTMEAAGKGLAKEIFDNIMGGKKGPDTTHVDTTRTSADTTQAGKKPARPDTTVAEPLKKAQEALEKIFKK